MKSSVAAVLRAFDDGRDRAEFYRGWRAGLAAGMTHPAILSKIGPRKGLANEVRAHLLEGTSAGLGVAQCVRRRPKLFEPFEAALLAMGEESGRLEPVLLALGDFHFRQYKMIQKIKQALSYPLFVSLVAVFIAPLKLVFMGQTGTYVALVVTGLAAWFFLGGIIFAWRAQAYQRRPAFVRARLARTLAMGLEAGLPLPRAVRLAAAASGDPVVAQHVARLDERTLGGQSLEATFTGVPAVTPDFLGTLRVTSATGDCTALSRLAELYEDGFK
jgi:type IV pilus assembly protein PilC